MANKAKHVRLPNGFGSIVKLNKPNLRNPYCARKTVGKTFDGKLIIKAIGYYKTYNDAYQALVLYNQNPYDLDANSITFTEVYKKWSDEYFRKLKNLSSMRSIESAFKYCTPLYKMRIKDIRVNHIRGTIYDSNTSAAGKSRMKSMLNLMFDWALERELVDKNYARILNIDDIHKRRNRKLLSHFQIKKSQLCGKNVILYNLQI